MEKNQWAGVDGEEGLEGKTSSEGGGNNGEHNGETVLIPWGTLLRKKTWKNWQGITSICISKMLLARHGQFELEIQ